MSSISNTSENLSPEILKAIYGSGTLREDTMAAVDASRAEDYDGHTEFHRLTPSQRLAWMEGALRFVVAAREAQAIAPAKKN